MRRANQYVGRKWEKPREFFLKPPDTPTSRTWLVSHVPCGAQTHTRQSGEMIEWLSVVMKYQCSKSLGHGGHQKIKQAMLYEPHHEKTCFLHMCENRHSDRTADQHLCVECSQKPLRQIFLTWSISSRLQLYEPKCVKFSLWGFRPGLTQTCLYSHRIRVEASNFRFKNKIVLFVE